MACYYDRTKAHRFQKLFGDTWIGQHPTPEHNRYMIIRYDFSKMVEVLSHIRSHQLPKAYILIDEYDNFTNQLLTAYNDPLYEEVTTNDSFLRTFFKVIKAGIGEGSIRTCFCTGVLPVTMDDLTSG